MRRHTRNSSVVGYIQAVPIIIHTPQNFDIYVDYVISNNSFNFIQFNLIKPLSISSIIQSTTLIISLLRNVFLKVSYDYSSRTDRLAKK